MQEYKELARRVLNDGQYSLDRTGTGTYRVFGAQMKFDCSRYFPLVTIKKTHFKSIVHELIWFLRGETNTQYLRDNGVTIWDEWADYRGELGPIYGAQWRNAGGSYRTNVTGTWAQDGVDQIQNAIEQIKNNPSSRRIIVDSYTVAQLPDVHLSPQENVGVGRMALAPCHMFFQFFVRNDGHLDVQVYMRSVDLFLGLPFNLASYALLLNIIAKITHLKPGNLIWTGGDVHLYKNHVDQTLEMLKRTALPLPSIHVNQDLRDINDITFDDIQLSDYQYHSAIKAEISI